MEAEAEGFEEVPLVPLLSLFKLSLDTHLPGFTGWDKKLAKHVQLVEDSLSIVAHNLIHQ
jgi:hypothetical protein